MNIKTNLANKNNYGGTRKASLIKYIVIHYTANDGDSDESNANYFKNNIVKASAHYFIDNDSITQSVPDLKVAYSVGGSKYSNSVATGGGAYYNKCTNYNSISIELADSVKNGKIYPTENTILQALELVNDLMKKYNIPKTNVIRHFDVTGKICPAYWAGNSTKNELWKTEFWNKIGIKNTPVTNMDNSNAIVYRLYTEGILSNKDFWIEKFNTDKNLFSFGKNSANYTLTHSKGNGIINVSTINDVIYKLYSVKIISDKDYWMKVFNVDTNIFTLAKNIANWIL